MLVISIINLFGQNINISYLVLFILGLLIGVIFALNWGKSKKSTYKIQDDVRIKNLIWILGPLLLTITGDKDILGINTEERISLIFYYLIGVIIGLIGILAAQWISILNKARKVLGTISIRHQFKIPDTWFFLQYGMTTYTEELHSFDENARKAMAKDEERFTELYLIKLSESITFIQTFTLESNLTLRKYFVKQLLQTVEAVVKTFTEVKDVVIKVNYMHAYSYDNCSPDIKQKLIFVSTSKEVIYSHILHLKAYSDDSRFEEIALPVAKDKEFLLPGAPTAFNLIESVIIEDTSNISFNKSVEREIREEIYRYFKSTKFESFISLPTIHDGKVTGIINVDAGKKNVFNNNSLENKRIINYLVPIGQLFTFLYKD